MLESFLLIPVLGPLCFVFTLPTIPNKLPHFLQALPYHPIRNNTHIWSLFSTLPCFIIYRPKHYHKICILIYLHVFCAFTNKI